MLRKPDRPVSETIGKLDLFDAFLIDSPDRFTTRIRCFQFIKNAQFQINDLLVNPPMDSLANASCLEVNNSRLDRLQISASGAQVYQFERNSTASRAGLDWLRGTGFLACHFFS